MLCQLLAMCVLLVYAIFLWLAETNAAGADATSIVLFEVFFEMVKGVERGEHAHMTILGETVTIAGKIGYMAAGTLLVTSYVAW